MFKEWRNTPIVDQLRTKLGQYEAHPGTFRISRTTPEYDPLCYFVSEMLEQLPFNNEVGRTVLMRSDAKLVTRELVRVLRGQQDWSQIAWVFTDVGRLELFKNLVYPSHNLTSAICYSVDLGTDFRVDHRVIVERIHIINTPDRFTGHYDGSFSVSQRYVVAQAIGFAIGNLAG